MEESVNELKMANLAVNKLDKTFDAFQSDPALSERWREVKGTFSVVKSSLLNRVKEIESKERDLVAKEKRIEDLERGVELKRKRVELSEKKVFDRCEVVKVKEKEVMAYFERKEKELMARFDEKASAIDARSKALEVKEKELIARFDEKAAAIDVRSKALEVKEKDLAVRSQKCSREIKGKARVIDVLSKALEMKEKELTEHFRRCSREMEGKATAIDVRSKALEMNEKDLTERIERCNKEMEAKATAIDVRSKALEVKEKDLLEHFKEKTTAIDERSKALEVKEKDLIDFFNKKETAIDVRSKALEVKEEELTESFQRVRKEFQVECEEMKLDISERLKELESKEKEVDERVRVLVSKETKLNELVDRYNMKAEQVDELARVMESKERELNERINEYNVKEKQIVRRRKVLELMEKDLGDKLRGCELKMEENYNFRRELDSKERELEERSRILEWKEKERSEQCESLELIETENDEGSKMLELKETESKQVHGSDKFHSLCRDMDANGLLSYLNERVNDHNELHAEVVDALRLASSPSKLVLDACKTFHGPYSAKLAMTNNQTSCIYLLELLMKLESEVITLHVSNEASKFANAWRSKLDDDKCDDSPRGNFGFLLFLAAFKLSGSYEVRVIAEHLVRLYSEEDIYLVEKHVTLCNALGIADDIPDIIQNLIHQNRPLVAVSLAYTFQVFHLFPPAPLLESYLSSTFTKAENVRRGQIPSKEAQIKYLTTKIGALHFAIRCIKKYNLISIFPIQPLENLSWELKREKLSLTRVSSLDSKDTYGNFTSLTPCRTTKNEVRIRQLMRLSETNCMSGNKRPCLFSVQSHHQPMTPPPSVSHSYTPLCNWVPPVPRYGNYPCWQFSPHQSLHYPQHLNSDLGI